VGNDIYNIQILDIKNTRKTPRAAQRTYVEILPRQNNSSRIRSELRHSKATKKSKSRNSKSKSSKSRDPNLSSKTNNTNEDVSVGSPYQFYQIIEEKKVDVVDEEAFDIWLEAYMMEAKKRGCKRPKKLV
jgi:ribosome assembly protein YihI (activator of Der GTPase)